MSFKKKKVDVFRSFPRLNKPRSLRMDTETCTINQLSGVIFMQIKVYIYKLMMCFSRMLFNVLIRHKCCLVPFEEGVLLCGRF